MRTLPFMQITAAAGGAKAAIHIRGTIDRKWDAANYTVTDTEKLVLAELAKIPEDQECECHINSPGGSVQMSLGLRNAFAKRGDKITFYNAGFMCSAATIIPPAKARVVSPKGSMWMIHDPSADPMKALNEEEAGKLKEMLGKFGVMMSELYAERTGMKAETCRQMMKATTWMTGAEAIAKGFADDDGGMELEEDDEDTKAIAVEVMAHFNLPEDLRRMLTVSADAGGQPATVNQPKGNTMNKIIAALVAAGYPVAADATEDAIVAKLNEVFPQVKSLQTENADLKAKAEEARKARIEAHVQTKVDAKVIGADLKAKWVEAILKDEGAQALLDAMVAPTAAAPAKPARGAAPAPAAPNGGKSNADKLNDIRAQMATEKDPEKIAALAIQARELRGHGDLFATPEDK